MARPIEIVKAFENFIIESSHEAMTKSLVDTLDTDRQSDEVFFDNTGEMRLLVRILGCALEDVLTTPRNGNEADAQHDAEEFFRNGDCAVFAECLGLTEAIVREAAENAAGYRMFHAMESAAA